MMYNKRTISNTQPVFLRRRDLDVTRELIVAGLILFHTASIFGEFGFYVKNGTAEPAVTLFIILTSFWGIPLLFMIAGFAVWHSLEKRTWRAFLRERLFRLLIPFMTGLVLVVPPQFYYQLRSDAAYRESYMQFLPHFFDITFRFNVPWFFSTAPAGNIFSPAHLWFLYILLVFTLLLLPVFLYLKRPSGQQFIGRVVSMISTPWGLVTTALPIAFIEAALGTDMAGGWNQNAYIVFLFYGFLLAADARFGRAVRTYRKIGFVLAVVGSLGGIGGFALIAGSAHADPLKSHELAYVMLRIVKGVVGWAWIVAILGFIEHVRQKRKLAGPLSGSGVSTSNRTFLDRVERYANEAVLPFYILHQTVIVIIAFYVVQWNVGAWLKFSVIAVGAFIITLMLYELFIKRTKVTRFLFGMKSRSATS